MQFVLSIKYSSQPCVFLFEGNEVNQLANEAMLKRLDCKFILICNGREASDKSLSKSLDLIRWIIIW